MKLYSQLSKIAFLKNRYVAKFLFVAFLGIHIPLIGLVFFVVYLEHHLSPMNVFLITLVLTLFATVITLIILKNLMIPVMKGSKALLEYRNNLTIPQLPTEYTDEAGVMMRNIQATILTNQKLLAEKKELFKLLTENLHSQTIQSEGLISNIISESTNDKVSDIAKDALQSVHQQLHFVDAFIHLLNEEALINKEQVKLRKINLKMILEEVKVNYKANLEAKNVTINYSGSISDVRLKINLKLLHKVFSFLLDNAIKYSSTNAIIEVTAEKVRGRLMLYIKDNGIGFEPDQAEKIFTKFRSKNGNTEEYIPGIGLYLTRQIVERFGGKINAESRGLNKGATFCVELKLYH